MKQEWIEIGKKVGESVEERAARMVEAADRYDLPTFTIFNGIKLTTWPASFRERRIVNNYRRRRWQLED